MFHVDFSCRHFSHDGTSLVQSLLRDCKSFEETKMTEKVRIGDPMTWISETRRVSGTIKAIHTRDFDYKGHRRHASEDDPNMRSRATRQIMSRLTKLVP